MQQYQYQSASQILFGRGASKKIKDVRPLRRVSRILCMSDVGVESAGILEPIQDALSEITVLTDTGVKPDGSVAHIDALAQKAKEHEVQAIVAIGGGSVMDSAKAVAAVLCKGGSIADYEGFATIRSTLMPTVCVPTTTGTGAEATQFVVVHDHNTGAKRIISDLSLVPTLAVLDPDLVMNLPREIAVSTAADALTHAIEALGSRMANPLGNAMAMEALRLMLSENSFEDSLRAADYEEARGRMLTAANLAGQAISASMLGACHAFAHAFGAVKQTPHGFANGLFLGSVMRFNLEKAEKAYAQIGSLLGIQGSAGKKAEAAIAEVERLLHQVAEIPGTLSFLEITPAERQLLVEQVMADPDLRTNPVSIRDSQIVDDWIARAME